MSFGSKTSDPTQQFPAETTSLANPITYYFTHVGRYPSNADIWWTMNRPPELGSNASPKLYLEVFDPGLRHQIFNGGSPAPQGHYILDAFHQDRSGASSVPNIPVLTSAGARPRAVAFFAGRAFLSGVLSAGFNTNIYYSPIIERVEQIGQCYQQFDPTSEDLRDLLPSDGGVITIPEITLVHHMWPMGSSLIVFAENGEWLIGGSEGIGFRANDYSVRKLSGVPTISNLSFVDVEGSPMWWNRSSINVIVPDEQGRLSVKSITDDTIKDFYQAIPEQSKLHAKGTYDPLTKIVQYLYRSTATDDISELYHYDRFLTIDTRTGAFMPWSTAENPRVQILGIFDIAGVSVTGDEVPVVVGGDAVVVGSDTVVVDGEVRDIIESKIKYIVNVLEDTGETPEVPESSVPDPLTVTVSDDTVVVGADTVVVYP